MNTFGRFLVLVLIALFILFYIMTYITAKKKNYNKKLALLLGWLITPFISYLVYYLLPPKKQQKNGK
jgi:RsiW-degrading membrane proteinase PrsW (M82 family)